jgi:hypothetical protein
MRKRTRTGSRLAWGRLARVAAAIALAGAALAGSDKKPKQKQEQSPYAVVAGTVFRENGMALAGAEVTLTAAGDSEEARKFKKMSTAANSRGEFAFHVGVEPMEYTVEAKAPRYQPRKKPASVSGETRIDVFFTLEPASK